MGDVKQGDIVVAECQTFLDSYVVLRVVKVGKVMWNVETLRKDYSKGWYFDRPQRRKVYKSAVYIGNDFESLAESIVEMRDDLWAREKAAKEEYKAAIFALPGVSA